MHMQESKTITCKYISNVITFLWILNITINVLNMAIYIFYRLLTKYLMIFDITIFWVHLKTNVIFFQVSNIQAPGGKNALRLQALCTMNEKAPESIWNVMVIKKIQNVTNFCGFRLQENYVYGTRVPLEARKGGNRNSKNFQCVSGTIQGNKFD